MDAKKERTSLAVRIFLVIAFLVPFAAGYFGNLFAKERFLEIRVLNVGQGDAILIKTPHNKKVLIDGGPKPGIVGKIPTDFPFFTCNVDVVLLTHSHEDHITGINSVLKRCTSSLLIINDIGSLKEAPKANLQITPGFSGDKFVVDDVNFYILWPQKDFSSSDANNLSIVVLVEYKGYKALFTGDAESDILSKVEKEPVNLLKVPHHGSSDEHLQALLQQIRPEVMAISVGENSFGHPSSQVLGAADSANVRVFRTDKSGDIVIKVDSKGNAKVETP